MFISKTPVRISFFGGGTDFEHYYSKYDSLVLGTTINKYIYISLSETFPTKKHNYSFAFKDLNKVKKISDIEHPCVKALYSRYNVPKNIQLSYNSNIIARSGLGTSSAFTVGLLNCILSLRNKKHKISKKFLSDEAYFIEKSILKENVGNQDQIFAAYGGLNLIRLTKKNKLVKKIKLKNNSFRNLESNLMIFYTNIQRNSNNIEKDKILKLDKKIEHYHNIKKITSDAYKYLLNGDINSFGDLLHMYWLEKKRLSPLVSNKNLDDIYSVAMNSGARGGKILGAGSGGFFMFYCEKKFQKKLINNLKKLHLLNFKFTNDFSICKEI